MLPRDKKEKENKIREGVLITHNECAIYCI